MEILLLIAIITVAAAGTFVAAAIFNSRPRQDYTPMIQDATGKISTEAGTVRLELQEYAQTVITEARENRDRLQRLNENGKKLQEQIQAITGELKRHRELLQSNDSGRGELLRQLQETADEARRTSELVKQLAGQTGSQADQLARNHARLDRRMAELSDSLDHQGSRISGLYRHLIRQEALAGDTPESDSLLLAVIEAESYADDKGWHGRPHLYALTEKTPAAAGDDGPASSPTGADALVLVEHEWAPGGDLRASLADIHWPDDVAGCVLVAEVSALPLQDDGAAPVVPEAPGQWSSIHPDGRQARIAIGVDRSGDRKCGLRIKGEDEMRVRTDLAVDDLVAALLRTF